MCIISGSVKQVSKTSILVSIASNDPSRQIVVYQNKVQLSHRGVPVKMILPVPVNEELRSKDPSRHGIIFYDLSEHNNIFEDLEKFFPDPVVTLSRARFLEASDQYLKIVKVGSYQCSIAPDIASIGRADPSIFGEVDSKLLTLLRKHYDGPKWAFVICTISAYDEFHPIAYSHDRPNLLSKLFVPTRHFHTHASPKDEEAEATFDDIDAVVITPDRLSPSELHRLMSRDKKPKVADTTAGSGSDLVAEDWDHMIYVYGLEMVGHHDQVRFGAPSLDEPIKLDVPLDMGFPRVIDPLRLGRIQIKGLAPNRDLYVDAGTHPVEPVPEVEIDPYAKVDASLMRLFDQFDSMIRGDASDE
jgi:hypothetical protein